MTITKVFRRRRAAARRRNQTLRRFAKSRAGSAAVEFSILAVPFFGMLYSIYEVGWYYFATSRVDSAVTDIGRALRTGSERIRSDTSAEEFFDEIVCPQLSLFGKCQDILTFEVETFASYTALANAGADITCRNDADDEIEDIKFDEVGENDIVRIRMCLLYTTLNPAVGVNLADDSGKRRLTNTFVFKSEPFERNQRNQG